MHDAIPAAVAAAANTQISESQFTFKWNFNFGDRNHSESLIYRKLSGMKNNVHARTVSRNRKLSKLEEKTLAFTVIYLTFWHPRESQGSNSPWGLSASSSLAFLHTGSGLQLSVPEPCACPPLWALKWCLPPPPGQMGASQGCASPCSSGEEWHGSGAFIPYSPSL